MIWVAIKPGSVSREIDGGANALGVVEDTSVSGHVGW